MTVAYTLFNLFVIGILIYFLTNYFKSKNRVKTKKSIPNQKPIKSTQPKKGVQVDVLQEGTGPSAQSGMSGRF